VITWCILNLDYSTSIDAGRERDIFAIYRAQQVTKIRKESFIIPGQEPTIFKGHAVD
jgi:hypothetical protein